MGFLEEAVEAARRGGQVIRSAFVRGGVDVRYKGWANPVTETDEESQRVIREFLLGCHPDHGFLGEEGTPTSHQGDWRWIVDPLDGTKNFAHGYPHFCVSIALEHCAQVVLGVIYDPLREELFRASRGGGAFLNERSIQVSRCQDLGRALLATGFALKAEVEHAACRAVEIESEGVRRDGSAALGLAYVACGRLDGFFQLALSPWDVAAGMLLVEEAQGTLTDYRGGRAELQGRQLVASNSHLHRALVERLAPLV